MEKTFGYHLILNLCDCNEKVLDPEEIKKFNIELCDDVLKMQRYKDALLMHFGEDELAGWTLCQMIVTSSVTCHFMDCNKNAYMDIFSCKKYDPNEVVEYVKNFFKPKSYTQNFLIR